MSFVAETKKIFFCRFKIRGVCVDLNVKITEICKCLSTYLLDRGADKKKVFLSFVWLFLSKIKPVLGPPGERWLVGFLIWCRDDEEKKKSPADGTDEKDNGTQSKGVNRIGNSNNPFLDIPHDPNAAVYKTGFLARKIHADMDGKKSECLSAGELVSVSLHMVQWEYQWQWGGEATAAPSPCYDTSQLACNHCSIPIGMFYRYTFPWWQSEQ